MGRLIDADRLKAHYAWWGDTESGSDKKRTFDTIVDLQPTAGPEWVPVPEVDPLKGYLPETEDKVLCCTKTIRGNRNIVIGYFIKEHGYWACGMNSNVIAWMPLPEPYKEGE